MKELTNKQAAVLAYIRARAAEDGVFPTVREIGRHFGLSSSQTPLAHLRALERKGYVAHPVKYRPRSLVGDTTPTYAELRAENERLRALLKERG